MLNAILSFVFICLAILAIYLIPIGFIYSVIFGILLLCTNNKSAVQKKHLPIISFIFLPTSIIIAIFLSLPFLNRGMGTSWDLTTSWELTILIPLMINTLLLLGWIFCREILSSAYYLLWTIVLLISASLGIVSLLISNFL